MMIMDLWITPSYIWSAEDEGIIFATMVTLVGTLKQKLSESVSDEGDVEDVVDEGDDKDYE